MQQTIVENLPIFQCIPGTVYVRLMNDVRFYSKVLGRWETIKAGFVCDRESTPWRGEDSIAGLIHDYVSRKGVLDSKILAARVYHEFQEYEDNIKNDKEDSAWYTRLWDWLGRYGKAGFVAVCPDFVYWHKYEVDATYEQLCA